MTKRFFLAHIMINDKNISNWTTRQNVDNVDASSIQYLEILRVILACSGMILNALNLGLIHQIRHSLRPYMRLILCLIISDFLLSVEVILFYAIKNGPSEFVQCIRFVLKSFETVNLLVLMLTLLLIASDQCVATLNPLRYHQIITKKRTNVALSGIWIFSCLVVIAGTILSTIKKDSINEIHAYDCFNIKRQYTFLINAILFQLSLPVFLGIYTVVYRNIRKLRGRDSLRGRNLSTRKATLTTLILIAPIVIIYLPVSSYVTVVSVFDLPVEWPF